MMNSAVYGRMRLGRCVDVDLGFIGCSADLMDLMDDQCSGRRTCQIPIFDLFMRPDKPCRKTLSVYLEAQYSCMHGKYMASICFLI